MADEYPHSVTQVRERDKGKGTEHHERRPQTYYENPQPIYSGSSTPHYYGPGPGQYMAEDQQIIYGPPPPHMVPVQSFLTMSMGAQRDAIGFGDRRTLYDHASAKPQPTYPTPTTQPALYASQYAAAQSVPQTFSPQPDEDVSPAPSSNARPVKNTKRAAQNRAAQKAFRERKEKHLKLLQFKSQLIDETLARERELSQRLEAIGAERTQLIAEQTEWQAQRQQYEHDRQQWEHERQQWLVQKQHMQTEIANLQNEVASLGGPRQSRDLH